MAIAYLLLTISVTNIYHRPHERPIPGRLKKLVLILSKIVCASQKLQGSKVDVASKDNNVNGNMEIEWRTIAKVLDRFFFVCAFVIATASSIGVFGTIYDP